MNKIKQHLLFLFCSSSLLILPSCDNEEREMYEVDRIVGSWKLVEVYSVDASGHGEWTPAEYSYSYNFNEDGTFTSTRFSQCTTGNYSIYTDELALDFECTSTGMGIASASSTYIEEFDYEGNNVIFIPTYPACDQGCRLKFEPAN
ncbi:lipocalin family protein [Zunongwangia atlantica]|uniref:Lipocalin-like domain-containing protein n=1 Tax=Zunongwangia atlantica 22II14-10F7 TaxID=1185767 RepID=A0A1Y1T948_9FLAO|nr:lipocalin family protein [Zunongwangia atlantica]ORL47075.1 hypothetical protein IIF7_03626 [Zunongwangia atlantica 22II14-10F7]